MARGPPHGRSKSDHRVCQAARYARASEYRERVAISAEKQEALIAAVNAQQEGAEPPIRRKQGQRSKEYVIGQRCCGKSAPRYCSSAGRIRKAAKRHLSHALNASAVKDPHALHCRECGTAAEYGLRGGKDGGDLKFFCRGHGPDIGVFLVDKDRAVWVSDRVRRSLEAEAVRLDEKMRCMGDFPSAVDSDCCSQAWTGLNSCAAFYSTEPMSRQLLTKLLMIGGIESNPGPSGNAPSNKGQPVGDPSTESAFGHHPQPEDEPSEQMMLEDRQPRETRLHGLQDATHFIEFKRRLREEKMQSAAAQEETLVTSSPQARASGAPQLVDPLNGDESGGSGSEDDQGEDIEGAEFEDRELELPGEETSQVRDLIDDRSQSPKNPVLESALLNAAMGDQSEPESLSQLFNGRFKRRAPERAADVLRTRRRARVIESPSPSDSPAQSPSNDAGLWLGGGDSDEPMTDAAVDSQPWWSSRDGPPPEPEDDGWSDLVDLSLDDDFLTQCMIVPRPQWAGSQAAAAPTAANATGASYERRNAPAADGALDGEPHSAPSAAPPPPFHAVAPGCEAHAPLDAPPSSPASQTAAAGPSIKAPVVNQQSGARFWAPRLDRCLAAAHRFHSRGVATMTLELDVYANRKGEEKKKPIGLKTDWATNCDLGNCLQSWVQPWQDCLAISTGASDVYALDIDGSAGGSEAFEEMLAEHGPLPSDTPWEWTGHRPGKHILFSMSQSKAAGLVSGRNKTRLNYKRAGSETASKIGVDTRGEGGLLFVGPSRYTGLDGSVREYEWVQEIAPDRSNLRALPGWLIGIINASDALAAASASRSSDQVTRRPFHPTDNIDDLVDHPRPPAPALLKRIEECVTATGDSRSRFDKVKHSPAGDMYVFRVGGERTCPYGAQHSGSNNFSVLVRGADLLYHCSSSECCDIRPLCKIGQLTVREKMLGGETAPFAADDSTVYGSLTKAFVDNWAFQGDKGGCRIVAQMYSNSHRLWHDSKSWWAWDGRRYEQTTSAIVRYVVTHQLSTVYGRLREELEEQLSNAVDDEETVQLASLLKQVRSYNNKHEVDATMGIMEGEMFQPLTGELDSDPDILNVHNGVLDLRTGRLDIHRPGYLCTKFADVPFKGLNHPTPKIDSFLADIFNNDRALIEFMQRLWGYSINGRTSEEIIVFLLGSGGNGKGVGKQMLESTLGAYYGVMSKDAVVKPPGQRPPSKGAATGYLAELQGKRVAITDETSPGERVDLGLVLMMTGGGQVTSRLLYQNNVTFRFTHTPFIQTNYDPEIPPTLAKRPNVQRRLIVVQFPNEYVSADKFDETNPTHKPVDIGLKDRMEAPEVREEFLTFLVKGSCAWYADPSVLHTHPPAVQAATMAWLRRGDKLQTFLQSEHCQMDAEGTPEVDQSVTWEDVFWTRFQEFAGMKIAKEELARQMKEKGYTRTKRQGRFDGDPSRRYSCYLGLECEEG